MYRETQHRVILFIKLHSSPTDTHHYHPQAKVYWGKVGAAANSPAALACLPLASLSPGD